MRSVMKRHEITEAQWPSMSLKERAILACRVAVYVVQCRPYIVDTIDKNVRDGGRANVRNKMPYENFGEALIGSLTAAAGGDCEDLAKAILTVILALLAHDFGDLGKVGEMFRTFQTLLRCYLPLMVLACVHGQQLSDADKDKVGGAHMTIVMLPLWYAKEALERDPSGAGARLAASTQWPDDMGHGLPTLILEGTGMLRVQVGTDPKAALRADLYTKLTSLASAKKWLYQPLDADGHPMESRFFMAALEGYTPTFRTALGRPEYGGFWLLNGKGERGVRFVDMLEQTRNFCIMPQPKLPEAVSLRMARTMSACFCLPIS
jgi:hypothetical protein